MTEQINKIKWVKVNPEDESTFPFNVEGNIMFGYKYNDLYANYLVTSCPSLSLITYYKDLFRMQTQKKLYIKHDNLQLEVLKWAVVDLGD